MSTRASFWTAREVVDGVGDKGDSEADRDGVNGVRFGVNGDTVGLGSGDMDRGGKVWYV